MKKIFILIFTFTIVFTGCSSQGQSQDKNATNGPDNNLTNQKICADIARDFFNNDKAQITKPELADYTNHYNQKLNKCFIKTFIVYYEEQDLITYTVLADAGENKGVAFCFNSSENKDLTGCTYNGQKTTYNLSTFEKFAKPYMED